MVTFGDMMSLLLCFFVIIVSMSEIKKDQQFQKVTESIKKAFGWRGGIGQINSTVVPKNSTTRMMIFQVLKKMQLNEGKSADDGIEGENPSVKTIREGTEIYHGRAGGLCRRQCCAAGKRCRTDWPCSVN